MGRAIALAALLLVPAALSAQWANHLPPGVPRTADGKPNLSAPAPRMPDGKPDLSGVWQNGPTGLGGAPSTDPNAPPAATFFNIGANIKGGLRMTFEVGANGQATALDLDMGMKQRATRVP